MTIYPAAAFRPLSPTQGQPRMARHDIVCLHTMVGSLSGTDRLFRVAGWGGTESHFGVGGKWGDGLDGRVYQWQDTEFTADANYEGNHRIISIETADNASKLAADIQPWTPKQLDAIVAITAWACKRYDIPAVLIPDSKPGRRGIGYHRLGCEHSAGIGNVPGFLVRGGERWSTAVGKECPGPKRIAQVPEIVARAKAILVGKPQEETMALTEQQLIEAIATRVWTTKPAVLGQQTAGSLREIDLRTEAPNLEARAAAGVAPLLGPLQTQLAQVAAQAQANGGQLSTLSGQVAGLHTKLDQVLAALTPPPPA